MAEREVGIGLGVNGAYIACYPRSMDMSKLTRGAEAFFPTYSLLGLINGQTFGDLKLESGLPTSTLKYQLRQLCAAEVGFAYKKPDEQDGRRHRYYRTEAGDEALRTGRGFTELPSPRAGWKRSDLNHSGQPRYQKKYRNEDGTISYGQPKNVKSPSSRIGSTSEGEKGQPPTSTSSRYSYSLEIDTRTVEIDTKKLELDTKTVESKGVDPIVDFSSPLPPDTAVSPNPPSPEAVFALGSEPHKSEWPKLEGEDLEWAKAMVKRGVLKPEVLTRGR